MTLLLFAIIVLLFLLALLVGYYFSHSSDPVRGIGAPDRGGESPPGGTASPRG